MKKLRRRVSRTDIALPAERTNGYRIFVEGGKIVTETSVHVSDTVKSWWQQTTEQRYE